MMRIWLLMILFCLPMAAWAETLPINHTMIVPGQVLRGSFTEERLLKGFKAPLRSTGHFVVAPGHGLIWSVEKPFAIITVITPNGLVQEVDGNQTMNMSAQKVPFLLHLYEMLNGTLAGDWTSLSHEFIMKRSGDEAHWQIELSPLKKDDTFMPFDSITATGSYFLDHISLNKTDGDADRITFSQQKLSASPLSAQESALLTPKP